MRHGLKLKWFTCAAIVLFVGVSLRFQRVAVTNQRKETQTRWRVLLPGQSSQVAQPDNTKLRTDEYVGYGLLHLSGYVSWKETIVNVD